MIFTTRKISNRLQLNNVYKNLSVRHLSLLECRSKEILQKFDVNIQKFRVVNNAADAAQVPDILKAKEYVIKAQVHAGGRGLGHFNKPMHMISPNLYGNIGNNFGRRFISTNWKVNEKSVPTKVEESVPVEKEFKMRNWIIVDNTENSKLRQLQRSSLILSLRQYCYVNVRWLHVKPTSRVFNEQMTVDFQEEPERDELNLNLKEIEDGLHERNREKENAPYQRGFNDACMYLLPELKAVKETHALKINTAQLFAAKLEFLLLYRNKIVRIEERYVKGMPSMDSDYLKHFTSKSEFHGISNETILGKKHFRAWLWLLVEGNEVIFTQLTPLRKLLKYDVTKYIWFADKMQGTFELLSDDNHTEGRELDVKFFVPAEVKDYVKILSPDLREAANIFFISEGWITET